MYLMFISSAMCTFANVDIGQWTRNNIILKTTTSLMAEIFFTRFNNTCMHEQVEKLKALIKAACYGG